MSVPELLAVAVAALGGSERPGQQELAGAVAQPPSDTSAASSTEPAIPAVLNLYMRNRDSRARQP